MSIQYILNNPNYFISQFLIFWYYFPEGIDYLRKEEHFPEQIAFITIGGITGLLLAFRKGFFKKLLYMASFAAGSAAIVYPDQASFYWETGKEHSGRTGTILYEFLNGCKSLSLYISLFFTKIVLSLRKLIPIFEFISEWKTL